MDMNKIAKDYGVEIVPVTEEFIKSCGMITNQFIDNSYIMNGKIIVGYYDDIEIENISILHELGHMLIPKEFTGQVENDSFLLEKEAWRIGIKVGIQYGMKFSTNALRYAVMCFETYQIYHTTLHRKQLQRISKKLKNYNEQQIT